MQTCLTHRSLKHTKPENYAMAFEILKIQSEQNYQLLTEDYQSKQNSHHYLQSFSCCSQSKHEHIHLYGKGNETYTLINSDIGQMSQMNISQKIYFIFFIICTFTHIINCHCYYLYN